MRITKIMGAGMAGALLLVAPCAALAQENNVATTPPQPAAAQLAAAQPPSSGPAASFVDPSFPVPTMAKGPGFKLAPLGPDLVKVDFDAYMSSIAHLQTTFSRSTSWPHEGITDAEAMQDMLNEQARFKARTSFAYSVLTPDGRRERGSVYVSPSPVKGYDAVVRMWVTKADYDAGFDAQLYKWVRRWAKAKWPFKSVAYPGRTIAWSDWDGRVAAAKASAAGTN